MSNKEIAARFKLLTALMELHGENQFRVRSYRNAYGALKRFDRPLTGLTEQELQEIPGIGKSTAAKIRELIETGKMERLESYRSSTPEGVQELLLIPGIGPKKVLTVWKELDITSPGELLYACNENRLIEASGFGLKTQQDVKQKLEYYFASQDKHLYARIEAPAAEILNLVESAFESRADWVGEFARKCPVVNSLELLIEAAPSVLNITGFEKLDDMGGNRYRYGESTVFSVHFTGEDLYEEKVFELTGSPEFVQAVLKLSGGFVGSEERTFEAAGLPSVVPEMREDPGILENALPVPEDLVSTGDICGILHNHCTDSDGLHSLREMAEFVRDNGFGYFGISDHSQSAVYANGLRPEEVLAQFEHIDVLNEEMAPFRIFKGIESDILNDGSLDYDEDLLRQFDFVVASVHSVLKMDVDRATKRLLTAIENPHTDILGHPTGRLLLAREGYPLDHMKVIDACAANGVVIELNANPLRLDLDYTWIPYAMEKGVVISINPDAHSKESIHNVRYGVLAARKGGLTTDMCLNCLPLEEFVNWIRSRA